MLLSDGGSALTSAGYAQVNGAQGVVDLGGNQGITITLPAIANSSSITPQQARIDLAAVIYITAETNSGSDFYKVYMVGSNSPGFASNNVVLGALQFGIGTAMDIPNAANTHTPSGAGNYPAGDFYELLFTNEFNGVPYEYLSMYVAGTFGSITFTAFAAPLPRI
jgi:hypothetical protein